MSLFRKPYLSDVSDEEWSLVVPYLLLQREGARQREHDLREVQRAALHREVRGAVAVDAE